MIIYIRVYIYIYTVSSYTRGTNEVEMIYLVKPLKEIIAKMPQL